MARIHNIGFERNTAGNGGETQISGTPTITSTKAYSGTYSLQLQTGNASGTIPILFGSATTTKLFISMRYYMEGITDAAMNPLQVRNGGTIVSRITLSTNGNLSLRDSSNATVGATFDLTNFTGQWLQFELMHDATTNPGSLELRLRDSNGSLLFSTSGANDVQGQMTNVRAGSAQTIATQMYMDDLIINDNTVVAGSSEHTWVGNQKLAMILPNAAGDSNQWLDTAAAPGTTNNYTLVDESPHDDATTMVQSGTLNNSDMYNFETFTVPDRWDITCITLNSRARNNTADAVTAVTYQLEKTSGGTKASGSAYIPNTNTWLTNHSSSTNPMTPVVIAHNDPDGSPWTQSTLNSLQAGFRISAANVNRVQVSSLWAYVSYKQRENTVFSITLAGQTLKTPNSMQETTDKLHAQNRVTSGSINRKYYGSSKRVWELNYINLNQTDYLKLKTIYENYLSTGSAVTLALSGTSYFQVSTSVHVDMQQIDFPPTGTYYLSSFSFVLREV